MRILSGSFPAVRDFHRHQQGIAKLQTHMLAANFGDEFTRQDVGDLMEPAKKLLEESIPEYQAVDDKEGVVLNLDSLGDVWRQSGELDKAEAAYQQAEVIARKMEDKNAIAYVLNGMGDLALDRGDLSLAGKRYGEALRLRMKARKKQTAAESRVCSLAKLAIEEGHNSDAETSTRSSKAQFHEEQQADDELNASIVLIDALLTQGKQGEARKEMEAAQRLGKESQNRLLRLQFELASARILDAERPEAAGPLLNSVNRDARRYRFASLEFETELALAELANKTE